MRLVEVGIVVSGMLASVDEELSGVMEVMIVGEDSSLQMSQLSTPWTGLKETTTIYFLCGLKHQ